MLSIINWERPTWKIDLLIPHLPPVDPYWERIEKLKGKQKISAIQKLYNKMMNIIKEHLKSDLGKTYLRIFNALLYEYSGISDCKKVELMEVRKSDAMDKKYKYRP